MDSMKHYSTYQSQFIEMFGNLDTNIKSYPVTTVEKISLNLFAGGDKPEDTSTERTDKYIYPVWANGEGERGLMGYSKTYRVDKEALTISARGTIGYCAIREPYFTPIVRLITLIPNEKVDIVYLKYFFDQTGFESTGAVQGQLTIPTIKVKKVLVPPIEEQMKFAEVVKQADKSKFTSLKSQFIEMFSAMTTTPVKTYVADSFPGEWGTEGTIGDGVKVIRTTNFTNSGKLNLADVVTRSIEDRKVSRKQIKKYDTILERSGGTADNPVGRVVLFDEDDLFLCNNFTHVLRFKDIDPRFAFYSLYYFYQTNKTAIRSMGSKTTGIQNLNMSKYLEIGIPNASDEEQKEFVAIAEQADKSKLV